MPRVSAGATSRPGASRSSTVPVPRSRGTGTRARRCGCSRRRSALSRGAIFHHFVDKDRRCSSRWPRQDGEPRWPTTVAGAGLVQVMRNMIAAARRRLARHPAGGLPAGAHRPRVPGRLGRSARPPSGRRPGPGWPRSARPACCAPTSTSTCSPTIWSSLLDGLVARLAVRPAGGRAGPGAGPGGVERPGALSRVPAAVPLPNQLRLPMLQLEQVATAWACGRIHANWSIACAILRQSAVVARSTQIQRNMP